MALLVADDHHRQVAELRQAADDRCVLVEEPVAEELLEVVEDVADVLERVRPVRVSGELDRLPRVAGRQLRCVDNRRRALGLRQPVGPAGRTRVQLEDLAQRVLQRLARLDEVELAVVEQEPRRLEAVGQLLADRLLDHLRAGEADVAPRLRDEQVAERRKGGADAAVGRVGQQRDVEDAFLVQPPDRLARLRELHQRDAALLHAGAAGGGDDEQRLAALEGELGGARDRLADAATHAAADEREVHRGEHERAAPDRGGAVEAALAAAGLPLRLLEPRRVRLRVREPERVDRLDLLREVGEAPLVEQLLQALADRQAEVEVALGADAQVPLQPLVVDEGLARRALRPLHRLGGGLRGCGDVRGQGRSGVVGARSGTLQAPRRRPPGTARAGRPLRRPA